MAKSKLSSAYKAAAGASAKHQASLYDVANIGYQRESSAQLAGIKAQDLSRTVGMISEGLDLVGNISRKRQRTKETREAAKALGAEAKPRSLWGKIMGEEQMWEKGGAEVSGSDVMAEYKLQQQEKAFGRSTETDKDTGKVTGAKAVETPPIPEVKEEKKEPTLAEEANIVGDSEPLVQGPTQTGATLDTAQSGTGFQSGQMYSMGDTGRRVKISSVDEQGVHYKRFMPSRGTWKKGRMAEDKFKTKMEGFTLD